MVLDRIQRWMLFPRYAAVPDPEAGRGVPGLERLSRAVDVGEVEAWVLPAEGASDGQPAPAVIFAHGNAELIDQWPDTLAEYRRMGMTVMLPELRGYGRSGGSPSERAITDDFVYFYDRFVARPEVDPKRIVFHGRSLGGGVVCALARHRHPAAMILTSTFTSIRAMARRYLMPPSLVLDPFDNEAVLRELDVPVLLAHGRHDGLVPYAHALALERVARNARLLSYNADHNDCPPDWARFWPEVRRFLDDNQLLPK